MSILIKGMEMPKRCIDCQFMISRDNDDCILQSDETNARFESWDDMKANCPLRPLPSEHGRLGDLDKLRIEMMDSDLDHLQRDDWKEVIQIIDDAPTIIEAEGEQDG